MKTKILSLLLALAGCTDSGGISVANPEIRETLPGQSVSVAYMTLTNSGQQRCVLERATAPGALVEIHQHLHNNGRMQMRQVRDVAIEAGKEVSFEPGGYHLMLMALPSPLKAGAELPLTFYFGECGAVEKIFPVVSLAGA